MPVTAESVGCLLMSWPACVFFLTARMAQQQRLFIARDRFEAVVIRCMPVYAESLNWEPLSNPKIYVLGSRVCRGQRVCFFWPHGWRSSSCNSLHAAVIHCTWSRGSRRNSLHARNCRVSRLPGNVVASVCVFSDRTDGTAAAVIHCTWSFRSSRNSLHACICRVTKLRTSK